MSWLWMKGLNRGCSGFVAADEAKMANKILTKEPSTSKESATIVRKPGPAASSHHPRPLRQHNPTLVKAYSVDAERTKCKHSGSTYMNALTY